MDRQPARIDFALIGHQESWNTISALMNLVRKKEMEMLTEEKIAEIYSFIPARSIFGIEAESTTGKKISGAYVESFIAPDQLAVRYWKKNLRKVQDAADYVRSLQAGVATLGGFTSIVLEGRDDELNKPASTQFTTGNALTAALIVKGIEKACLHFNEPVEEKTILIVGSTGDIGSACTAYLKQKCKRLLLCARQIPALRKQEAALQEEGIPATASTSLEQLLPEADIIICITNSILENFRSALCKKNVIICDAGYPKNISSKTEQALKARLFYGGMGQLSREFKFTPDVKAHFYHFPVDNVVHGCLLEAAVLAFEENYTAFSTGKGNISAGKINTIWELAQKHGVLLAPFFNANGLWAHQNFVQ